MSLPKSLEVAIDLRSDTVTLPTPAMLEAISGAPLGDDVYGEDPTVNALERRAARMLGKEAAVLVPSGTMANLAALLAHCPRGRKVVLGDQSDMWLWEAGGASVLGGLVYEPVATGAGGELPLDELAAALDDPRDPQCAEPGVVCLENTHCMSGGRVLGPDYMAEVRALADRRGVPLHLDGARLFNAVVASGIAAAELTASADSVSFCLSKGLGAPIGSVVAGGASFVERVRRWRKMLGGGMRQAGLIAAAGLYALEHHVDRLAEDHATARRLHRGLADLPWVVLDPEPPQTNVVFWRLADPLWRVADFVASLAAEGVGVGELGRGRIRAVTHLGIRPEDVDAAVESVRRVGARRGDLDAPVGAGNAVEDRPRGRSAASSRR